VELLGPVLTAQLSLLASYASINLQQLSVRHLVSQLLPHLLPSGWRQAAAVPWQAADGRPGVTW
jgi:hypothetical protein